MVSTEKPIPSIYKSLGHQSPSGAKKRLGAELEETLALGAQVSVGVGVCFGHF